MRRREYLKKTATLISLSPFLTSFLLTYDEKKILTRAIPSSGEQLPVVGVGTWQTFDVGNSESEREPLKKVLQILVENGGKVIDSSPMYGRSEGVAGTLAKEMNISNQLFMATKVWTTGKEEGIKQMNTSMALMNKRPMDLMQVHNLVDWKTHRTTLRQWKEEGKTRYLGITHYSDSAYDAMARIIQAEPLDFIQIDYSIDNINANDRLLPLAKEKGIAVLINRPYSGGSLFSKTKGKTLPPWARELDIYSWGQYFLKYILGNDAVTCVIPGTDKPEHMLDNVGAGFGRLPDKNEMKKMKDWLDRS